MKFLKNKLIIILCLALCASGAIFAFTGCGDTNPPGTETYTFGAELTNLDDVEGEGFSGGSSGVGMIAKDMDGKWKTLTGYYVSFLYVEDTAITFEITSDKAVDDAKLELSLSAEGVPQMTLTNKSYTVSVNDEALAYSDITFYNIPNAVGTPYPFKSYEVGASLHLNEGKNIIKLISSNNVSIGGTTRATAPMVDAIKITTSATLTWEPRMDNLDQFA